VPDRDHPLLRAVEPLLARLRADLVDPADLADGDVPLVWEGTTVAGVRLSTPPPSAPSAPAVAASEPADGGLAALLEAVAAELGAPLADLPREDKQRAVRLLEGRGAFSYRRSAETIAEALGVTRFTVYNYLNRRR
jgi:DNA-directed RNA polymerase specialized sigma24 family protein